MTTRADVSRTLAHFAGPLGPFESLDAFYARRATWMASLDPREALPLLVDLLVRPPDEHEIAPATREYFDLQLAEVLWTVGARDSETYLRIVGPWLSDRTARPAVIQAIGELGDLRGLASLEPLATEPELSDDELVRLAGAFREIGGADAERLLSALRFRTGRALDDAE